MPDLIEMTMPDLGVYFMFYFAKMHLEWEKFRLSVFKHGIIGKTSVFQYLRSSGKLVAKKFCYMGIGAGSNYFTAQFPVSF